MGLSSYEVVRKALEFQRPDRLPLDMEALGLSDIHIVNWNQIGSGDKTLRKTVDEWGCVWSRTEIKNMGQVTGHPLCDWEALAVENDVKQMMLDALLTADPWKQKLQLQTTLATNWSIS